VQKKNSILYDSLSVLKRIPVIRYLKEPVDNVSRLYLKYPDGAEGGSFVFVMDENMFYGYSAEKRLWEAVGGGIGEAPDDGKLYGRQNGKWVETGIDTFP
jgi:hypothetical protein